MKWYGIIGLFAAICIAIYMMPQLIKTIKTKNTVGISIAMLILAIIGDLFFVINGIGILADTVKIPSITGRLSSGLPLFLANVFASGISIVLAYFKFSNLHMAKKLNLTEKDFCANYEDNVASYKRRFAKAKKAKKEKAE